MSCLNLDGGLFSAGKALYNQPTFGVYDSDITK